MNKPIVLSQPPFPDFSLAIVAYVRLIPTSLNLFHSLWKHQSPYEVCLSKTLFLSLEYSSFLVNYFPSAFGTQLKSWLLGKALAYTARC